ncbi:MAG: hypothetical protein HDR24_00325 [Lachnospiraceae bacterium]|nr:hypothetical protein [Lachnospiraceae bacterium]
MEKLVEFLTNRIGITVSVIGGVILPGCLFIYVFDKDVFLEMNLIKLLILASAICLAVYVVMFVLFALVVCLSESQDLKKYDLTDILLHPLVHSNMIIYACILEKLFKKDLPITHFIKRWVVAIFIVYALGYIYLFFSIWRIKRKAKRTGK